jgi:NAD(P)-dependent dehydrogenase (short-subunit alcohol dehydrogenase family)
MTNSIFDLNNKKAIVTGAGRGIGRAIALGLANAGVDVGLLARSEDQLAVVAKEIEKLGRKAVIATCDLSKTGGIKDTITRLCDDLQGIDILVNNAGTNIPQKAMEISSETWDTIIDLNMKACFFVSQAVGQVMIAQGRGGRIVNMSSQAGTSALDNRSVYCASKAGVDLLTKCLALEWAEYKILVNAVAPTFTVTEMTKKFMEDPEYLSFATARNLLGRLATPEDMIGAVLFLCSEASSMVTGHILAVDAGWNV